MLVAKKPEITKGKNSTVYLIDAVDMRTVKNNSNIPHYRVDPHNFGIGMELARETSVLAKKTN